LKPEAAFQKSVIDVLTILGYRVFETGKSRSKVRCTKCGTYSYATGWQGNTPGLPDIYIHSKHRTWNSTALAIELKTEKGVVSQIQKDIAEAGYTTICRSIDEVIDVVLAKEAANENWTAYDRVRRFKDDNEKL
jgi:hypothetical protein